MAHRKPLKSPQAIPESKRSRPVQLPQATPESKRSRPVQLPQATPESKRSRPDRLAAIPKSNNLLMYKKLHMNSPIPAHQIIKDQKFIPKKLNQLINKLANLNKKFQLAMREDDVKQIVRAYKELEQFMNLIGIKRENGSPQARVLNAADNGFLILKCDEIINQLNQSLNQLNQSLDDLNKKIALKENTEISPELVDEYQKNFEQINAKRGLLNSLMLQLDEMLRSGKLARTNMIDAIVKKNNEYVTKYRDIMPAMLRNLTKFHERIEKQKRPAVFVPIEKYKAERGIFIPVKPPRPLKRANAVKLIEVKEAKRGENIFKRK